MSEITKILEERGALLGRELLAEVSMDAFELWRACRRSREIRIKRLGRRYIRFDRKAKNHTRLSPSIQREFTTYSLLALSGDAQLDARAEELKEKIRSVSSKKLGIAKKVITEVVESLPEIKHEINNNVCFIIGGDVALGMAHDEPRPERSTGEMVAGSDLDVVAIADDKISKNALKRLDAALHDAKHLLLRQPQKEELDYIIKKLSKVERQARFDSFENRIACKIINESKFLCGSRKLYKAAKEIMKRSKVPEKLRRLHREAANNRAEAERYLLGKKEVSQKERRELFSTTEEFSEIF